MNRYTAYTQEVTEGEDTYSEILFKYDIYGDLVKYDDAIVKIELLRRQRDSYAIFSICLLVGFLVALFV